MSGNRTREAVRRDYGRLAEDYERRWQAFNAAVRDWVLARWPDGLADDARVLDLGCGTGAFLGAVGARFPALQLTGLDLTPALLVEARRRAPSARLVEGDVESPPFKERTFDVVCSLNVLHHLHDRQRHIDLLAGLCRPGGTIFLCTFAGGRSLAMRAADAWLRLRNRGWRGMLSAAELERCFEREPRIAVRERGELRAGFWWLQVFRLYATGDEARPARS